MFSSHCKGTNGHVIGEMVKSCLGSCNFEQKQPWIMPLYWCKLAWTVTQILYQMTPPTDCSSIFCKETLNSSINLGTLTDISRLCFNLSSLHFSWSDNSASQTVFKWQISLGIILPCSSTDNTNPIGSLTYARYWNTPPLVASVWRCENFTSR